jgi:hypothetical protein
MFTTGRGRSRLRRLHLSAPHRYAVMSRPGRTDRATSPASARTPRMRLPHTIRTLIVLVLVAWMPWCLCRWVPQGCDIAPAAKTNDVDAASCESCCHACCDRTDADAEGSDTQRPARKACSGCPSACCAPKLSIAQPLPDVPCDLIGIDLPPPLDLDLLMVATIVAGPSRLDLPVTHPPGEPHGSGSGRSHLLQASVLLT